MVQRRVAEGLSKVAAQAQVAADFKGAGAVLDSDRPPPATQSPPSPRDQPQQKERTLEIRVQDHSDMSLNRAADDAHLNTATTPGPMNTTGRTSRALSRGGSRALSVPRRRVSIINQGEIYN